MKLAGAVRHELARLITRRRYILAGLIAIAMGAAAMYSRRSGLVSGAGIEGFIPYSGSMLWLTGLDEAGLLFIVWPLIVGGTLAEDLESDLAALLVTRAGSRWVWLAAKVAAAFIASTGALLAMASVWLAFAAVLAPWDPSHAGAIVPWGRELAVSSPVLLGAAVVLILGLAATATCAMTMLLGACGAGRVASQVGASVLYVACMFGLPGPLNPGDRASVLSEFAEWATPSSTTAYWGVLLAISAVATYLLVRYREAR
ncbi:MAG: hypothetical protein JXP37_09045 [Coriobacteriia bacterium]|nr:hypothetical protein [Coriobacteriia bacterium]